MASKKNGNDATTKPSEWKTLKPMTTKRQEAEGMWVNDHQFLVIGGKGVDNTWLSSGEFYDTKKQTWNAFVDLPFTRSLFGIAMVGDRLFVVGGQEKYASNHKTLISIDLSGGDLSTLLERKWVDLPPMSTERICFACASHGNFIYVFGGLDGENNRLDTAERFNVETNKWESLPNVPGSKRNFCEAGVVGNKIYVVGGKIKDGERKGLAETLVFDTSKTDWESSDTPKVPNLRKPRYRFSIVVKDRFVVAIGGENNDGLISGAEVLDTERNVWESVPMGLEDVSFKNATVGFLKKTNEILMVTRDEVQCICFEERKPPEPKAPKSLIGDILELFQKCVCGRS